jgi:hypothetical protein
VIAAPDHEDLTAPLRDSPQIHNLSGSVLCGPVVRIPPGHHSNPHQTESANVGPRMIPIDFSGIIWTITWKERHTQAWCQNFSPTSSRDVNLSLHVAQWPVAWPSPKCRSWGSSGKWRVANLTRLVQLVCQMRISLGRDPELRCFLAELPRLSRKQITGRLLVSFWADVLGNYSKEPGLRKQKGPRKGNY